MVDQVKVIEIGADAIEEVLLSSSGLGLAYPPKLMHAVIAALGRHGFIIEDRYEDSYTDSLVTFTPVTLPDDWGTDGDDA